MTKFNGEWLPDIANRFLNECIDIVNDESKFNTFKQNSIFCQVIGNDIRSKELADIYYNNILANTNIINNIKKYKSNDIIGNPILYEYPNIGYISPGTLYFLNILQDLQLHFGDISNFNIVEIGTGYGGQAKIILDSNIISYTAIDVEPTLNLCKKYLNSFNYNNITFYDTNSIIIKDYDLVISNWCLSEFNEEGIKYYIDTIIKHCNNGYFLMNIWDERKQFLLDYLKQYFTDIQIFPENPKTHSNDNWTLIIKK